MTKELKKDKLIAAGMLSQGFTEDPPVKKVRIFRKGDILRRLWTSGIVRDSNQPQGSKKISDEESAMWQAMGEAAICAPAADDSLTQEDYEAIYGWGGQG